MSQPSSTLTRIVRIEERLSLHLTSLENLTQAVEDLTKVTRWLVDQEKERQLTDG